MVTLDVTFPPDEELYQDELAVSSATLRAASNHLGKYCESVNNEYMLCRCELNDPRKCIDVGIQVTKCSLDLFRKVKKNCLAEFNQYLHCIDKSSGDFSLTQCRKTQAVFDQCMLEKLQIERPDFGYFCRGRIHNTKREAPKKEERVLYADATPALPADAEKKPPRFTSRLYWINE